MPASGALLVFRTGEDRHVRKRANGDSAASRVAFSAAEKALGAAEKLNTWEAINACRLAVKKMQQTTRKVERSLSNAQRLEKELSKR